MDLALELVDPAMVDGRVLPLLQKPFTYDALDAMVRELLRG